MALVAGTRLGPFEIQSALGAGGMGEVYKARDTRLDRTVAIKVLPEALASDPQFRERFDREARTISQLTHAHICTLYDVGRQDLTDFLVMEYLEGDTLADRLGKGALPLDQALTLAIEIASALDQAHRAGITHRDLKPGNIMVTRTGAKLLDFGLAKARASVIAGAQLSMLPTTPPGLTAQGTILGTFQYMAPEQLEGREADARSDIFAFGAVVYEMLTGKKAFEGKSHASLISAIMSSDPPPISALQPLTPPGLDHLVRRCLAKDPDERWQTSGDVMRELKWLSEARTLAPTAAIPVERRGRSHLAISWTVAAACAAAAMAFGTLYSRSSAPVAPLVRFEVPGPGPRTPSDGIAISPDGRRVVYFGDDGNGGNALWVRSLDSLDAQKLPGTENRRGYIWPFWSADSRFIGFANGGKLQKIDVTGGSAETITGLAGQFGGGAWNREGTVLFASNDHGLQRVAAAGGTPAPVTQLDASLDESYHDCPSFLPDGRHFLYLGYSTNKPENRALYAGSLEAATRTRLMTTNSCAAYAAPGFILFVRDQTLFARPFNANRLEFTGDATPMAQGVAAIAQDEVGMFAVSDAGTLIFSKASPQAGNRRMQWMDRTRTTSMPIGPPIRAASIRLSPDDKRVLFSEGVNGGPDDVWIYEIDRDVKVRLTSDPSLDHNPVWSPDGSRVAFDSHRVNNAAAVYEMPASGAVPERAVLPGETGVMQGPTDWSSDGRMIVFQRAKAAAPVWSLWVLPLSGDRKPYPYAVSPFSEVGAALSPNGHWLAYASNESGKFEVIVQPFPDASGGKWQISTQGGGYPQWKRDGRELYYLTPGGGMVAVSVTTEPGFGIGKSTALFPTPLTFSGGDVGGSPYDVTTDGQRFLLLVPAAATTAAPITVVLNWPAGLKK